MYNFFMITTNELSTLWFTIKVNTINNYYKVLISNKKISSNRLELNLGEKKLSLHSLPF